MYRPHLTFVLLLIIAAFVQSCKRYTNVELVWTADFDELGSSSSPRCIDLNNDGVLDIVIGASRNEFENSDSSVLALDGKTGSVVWNVGAKDQVVGSASFLDVTGDKVPDVFIGGRSAEFVCIDGATGKMVWRYEPLQTGGIAKLIRFNFFNAQFVPDQDNDLLPDLLLTNGGNARALANTSKGRYPGVLAIFSSKNGQLLAADTVPDGKETYMSPVIYDFTGKGQLSIIFGTGGETLGGNLFITDLSSLRKNDISKAIKIASGDKRGFIAPPTLADVNNDGVKDILVNWFGGKMIAIDGTAYATLWELAVPNTEVYSSVVPGFFTKDSIPDFFSSYNKGAWPDNKGSIQLLVNGKDGSILKSDSLSAAWGIHLR